jgi:hypothetical protein
MPPALAVADFSDRVTNKGALMPLDGDHRQWDPDPEEQRDSSLMDQVLWCCLTLAFALLAFVVLALKFL